MIHCSGCNISDDYLSESFESVRNVESISDYTESTEISFNDEVTNEQIIDKQEEIEDVYLTDEHVFSIGEISYYLPCSINDFFSTGWNYRYSDDETKLLEFNEFETITLVKDDATIKVRVHNPYKDSLGVKDLQIYGIEISDNNSHVKVANIEVGDSFETVIERLGYKEEGQTFLVYRLIRPDYTEENIDCYICIDEDTSKVKSIDVSRWDKYNR